MKFTTVCLLLGTASTVLGHAVSKDGICGGKKGQTCLNSQFGNCCSQYGYCGKTAAYCGTGCQNAFGSCNKGQYSVRPTTSKPSTPTNPPSGYFKVSKDGSCGKGVTCLGSQFGNCCSKYGYCGRSKEYCGNGCQSAFGSCSYSPAPAPSLSFKPPSPSSYPVGKVSKDGKCGGSQKVTCLGSNFGDCCSQYNYCGSSSAYCGKGCQSPFGKCSGQPSSSRFPSTSTTSSSYSSSSPSSSLSSSSSSSSSEVVTSTSSSESSTSTTSSDLSTSTESSSTSSETSSTFVESTTASSEVLSTITKSSSSESTTAAPTTTESSTSSSSTEASSTTSVPAPHCTSLPNGETCPNFSGSGDLNSNCPASNGACQNGYQAQCGRAPPTGSSTILQRLDATVNGFSGCQAACDANEDCKGFEFTPALGQVCVLYSRIDELSTSFVSTFVKVCNDAGAPAPSSSSSMEAPTTTASSSSTEAPSSTSTSTESSSSEAPITTTIFSSTEVSTSTTSTAESSSSEAPITTTVSSSTEVPTSTTSSAESSSSAPPRPTCATNALTNGGFESGSFLPFAPSITSGTAQLTVRFSGTNNIAGPHSGSAYLEIATPRTPIVTLSQTLRSLQAGVQVACQAVFSFPSDGVTQSDGVQVSMYVDGQLCGNYASAQAPGWQNVGIDDLFITIQHDNPVFEIVTWFTSNNAGKVRFVGLDSVRVVPVPENDLPTCPENQGPI